MDSVPLERRANSDKEAKAEVALMDAASCFLLCAEAIRASSAEPSTGEFRRMLQKGRKHKQALPRTLFVAREQVSDLMTHEATRQNISVVSVPESELLLFIGEARESFGQQISGGPL